MENKQGLKHPFLLSTTLIVLSVLALVFNGILIYTAIFYVEAERGLEIYLADTFAKFPFIVIYILLVFFSLLLLVSVVLMWLRKTLGLFLYFSWSFALILLLLFAEQFDWFNMLVLVVLVIALSLNFSSFSTKLFKGEQVN
jgi:hypothetical protein